MVWMRCPCRLGHLHPWPCLVTFWGSLEGMVFLEEVCFFFEVSKVMCYSQFILSVSCLWFETWALSSELPGLVTVPVCCHTSLPWWQRTHSSFDKSPWSQCFFTATEKELIQKVVTSGALLWQTWPCGFNFEKCEVVVHCKWNLIRHPSVGALEDSHAENYRLWGPISQNFQRATI